jgi:RHS repeat-associated protein
MLRKSILLSLVFSLLQVMAADAQASERYIVILKHRAGAAPEVARLGGTIEFRQEEQLVVALPREAVETLRADPLVLYVQKVGAPEEAPLIGTPADPAPGNPPVAMARVLRPRATAVWDSGDYAYDAAGNITAIGTTHAYYYDAVQRLAKSTINGVNDNFAYDSFGNFTAKSVGGQPQTLPPFSTATNRCTTCSYDTAGNVTGDGTWSLGYDAANMAQWRSHLGTNTEFYVYTASDERIGVLRSGWWHWSVRDESGKVLRQYRSSVSSPSTAALWVEDYVWRDGLLLGSQRPTEMGGRRHFHLDHLGTPRLITSDSGQQVSWHGYYPFGEELSPAAQETAGGFDREEPLKFTGHERDFVGGPEVPGGSYLDYMHARYYNSTAGRLLSVDPVISEMAPRMPQLWNRYAYTANNPISRTDPDGREVYLQNFSAADQTALVAQLEDKTGLDLDVQSGKLVEVGVLTDPSGKVKGSAIARADLQKAMGKNVVFIVQSVSRERGMGDRTGPIIKLEMKLISQIKSGKNDPRTMDASMILIHEMLAHGVNKLSDPPRSVLRTFAQVRGSAVDYDNKVRSQLGLPTRSQYRTELGANGRYFIPFSKGDIYVPEPVQ